MGECNFASYDYLQNTKDARYRADCIMRDSYPRTDCILKCKGQEYVMDKLNSISTEDVLNAMEQCKSNANISDYVYMRLYGVTRERFICNNCIHYLPIYYDNGMTSKGECAYFDELKMGCVHNCKKFNRIITFEEM